MIATVKKYLPLAVICLIGALYIQTRYFDYVWDDRALFINSPALRLIHSPTDLWRAISQPILPGTTYFRPLVMLTFAAEFGLVGIDPFVSHLLNLALLLVNVWLVGLLAKTLSSEPQHADWYQALAMLMYGLHPANTEATSWVAGRFDLMVTTFGLSMLLAALQLTGWRQWLAVGGSFFLACMSKEMAVVLPIALLVLIEVRRGSGPSWHERLHAWRFGSERALLAPLALAGLVYLGLRFLNMPAMAHTDKTLASTMTPWTHVLYIGRAIWFYGQAALVPFVELSPQHPLHVINLTTRDMAKALAALLLAAVLVATAVKTRKPVTLLVAGFVLCLAPVLHIIPLSIGGNIGHERFLTFPLALLTLAGCALIANNKNIQTLRPSLVALAGWLLICGMNTAVTIPLWGRETALWTWAYQTHPENVFIQASVVNAYITANEIDKAKQTLAEIQAKYGGTVEPNLLIMEAQLEIRSGNPASGLDLLDKALPKYIAHLNALADITYKGRADAKEMMYRESSWYLRFAYVARAEALVSLRRFDEAAETAKIGIAHDPEYPPGYLVLGFAYYGLNRWQDGEDAVAEAMRRFVPQGRLSAQEMRADYLRQVCASDSAPTDTCRAWKAEAPGARAD